MTTQERIRKTVPVHWELSKSDSGVGTLTGWASVYGNVDRQDEIVVPGAFTNWLANWRKTGDVLPLTMDHDNSVGGTIGSLVDVIDKPYGLRTTFQFSSTQDAQDARRKAMEGHIKGLSIFGFVTNKSIDMVDDKPIRILREVDLLSVGLTPIPANPGAQVVTVKSVGARSFDDLDRMISEALAQCPESSEVLSGSDVDALLAQAIATGVIKSRPPADAYCGQCTPCRNGLRSDCIRRGTDEAWGHMKARKAEADYWRRQKLPTLDEAMSDMEQAIADVEHAQMVDRLRAAGYPVSDGRSYQWTG